MVGSFLSVLTVGRAVASVPATGTIDLEKAFNESNEKKQLDQELQTFRDQLRQELDLRSTHKLLSPEEFEHLSALKAKPDTSDADKKKLDELMALSKQRDQELQGLQQKQNPSDAEKARLKELQEQVNTAEASLKEKANESQIKLNNRTIELSRRVTQAIESAVSAIAKEKSLSLVFNKSFGEVLFVVYSSVDLTDEVLKRLNKK